MPEAYSQRGWGGNPGGGGANIQPYMGNILAGRFGGAGVGAGAGFGFGGVLARRRMLGSAGLPGGNGPGGGYTPSGGRGDPAIQGDPRKGLPDTGALGELGMSPEQWVQNRHAKDTSFQQLQGLIDSRNSINAMMGRGGRMGGMGQGAGFGQPDDMIKKLLMARMGGGGL